jgi:hypothetical protein
MLGNDDPVIQGNLPRQIPGNQQEKTPSKRFPS